MKKIFLLMLLLIIAMNGYSQTNKFESTGDAGLGTTTPASVYYSGTSPHLQLSNRTSLFQLAGNTASYLTNNLYFNNGWKYHQNGAGAFMFIGQGAVAFTYAATNASGVNASADPNYSMYIDENGKVGVGTTGPDEKFQVTGGRIYANGTGTGSGFTLNTWSMYQTSGNVYNLRYNTTDILTANASGNVGIGTTSPTEKFSVNGNAYINGNISTNGFVTTKKLTVTQTGWSDYVFDKDYKLRSLSSLETFINQNKHLPDIPSAKEVEEKGISVGDNQALLLKKIEELTLYIIALQREVNILKKQKRKK
jgi:hypothetical protein